MIWKEEIILVNPPSKPGTTANREGTAGLGAEDPSPHGFFYPPQTIAYTGAVLRQEGWDVRAMDAVAEHMSTQDVLASLGQSRERIVGVMISYATLETDLAFLEKLCESADGRLIIAFGPATRYLQQQLSRVPITGIVLGEPERSFGHACLELLKNEREGGSLLPAEKQAPIIFSSATLGVTAYDENGFLQDLDSLPYPAWDLLPYSRYRFLTIISSRGCDDRCRYCPYVAAQGSNHRARAPEHVVDELAWLMDKFRPVRIVFRDPVFARDRERVVQICEEILARGIHTNWECESRPEHFDESLLRLMRRAGCEGIKIGLETASGALLYRLGRLESKEQAAAYREHLADLVRVCKAIGLRCRLFVMLGLPGEDKAAQQETLEFVSAIQPTALNIKLFHPYPGIRLLPEEQKAAVPPDATIYGAFLELKKRCESEATGKAIWQKARRRLSKFLARTVR